MIEIEPFDLKAHYSTVAKWWFQHSGEVLEFALLPKTGFIAFKEGTPICACFLLLTNSAMSIISYVVSSPAASNRDIAKGFDRLIEHCDGMSRMLGTKFLLSVSTSVGFSKKLKRRFGFTGWRLHELVFKKL